MIQCNGQSLMVINRNQNSINAIINYLRNSPTGVATVGIPEAMASRTLMEFFVFGGKAVHRGTPKSSSRSAPRPSRGTRSVWQDHSAARDLFFDLSVSAEYDLSVGETRQDFP